MKSKRLLAPLYLFSVSLLIGCGPSETELPDQLSVSAPYVYETQEAETTINHEMFPPDDQELARLYAPVLYFHAAELFRPQSVDVLVNTARLRQTRRNWLDTNILPRVNISDLINYKDAGYNLDAWYGDEGASDYKNYSIHRSYYQSVLSPEVGGPPIVTYAHIVRDENPLHITIQYWFFYYYNDWFNKHEGDWEMVQVVLSSSGEPEWLILSQHHGGTRRPWISAKIEDGTHPAVYVALGSHANYFWGDETYPCGTRIGNAQFRVMDRTGTYGRVIPEVRLIPDREDVELDPESWTGLEWLHFSGRWGEVAPQSDFSGPFGPADKGDQWKWPYVWGMSQPLDMETWYANRLRVEIKGEQAEDAMVNLKVPGGDDTSVESLGRIAILHTDPPSGEEIIAEIETPIGSPYDIVATWPDPSASEITRFYFFSIPRDDVGKVILTLQADKQPTLFVEGIPYGLIPARTETGPATWDAPDLVWVAGILPESDVVKGVAICLLAGLLPTLIYVTVLYHADRYEKEPLPLIAAAFYWGAYPALLVAIIVRVFFRLPVDLLGPEAIQAVQAGLVAPIVEELLKGLVVIVIAVRYRIEFDDVLDGIIYGALVGFGFAMTGNTLSYLGAFLMRGFAGLSVTIFIEGVLYGLNHGVYTAIFGAGLGYARLTNKKWQRWVVPLVAFGLAVASHALHNFVIQNTVGINLLTIAMTLVGVIVIIVAITWSLRRERQWIKTELIGEIPDEFYQALTERSGRLRAQWHALWRGGLIDLRRERRIHQQCVELAFKKMQHKLNPDELSILDHTERLRKEIQTLAAQR